MKVLKELTKKSRFNYFIKLILFFNLFKVPGETNFNLYEVYGQTEKNIILNCNNTGIPKPTITWYSPQNLIIDNQTNISRYIILDNKLEILSFKSTDIGIYKCLATNDFSFSYMKNQYGYINLNMHIPPLILNKTKNYYINDSSSVILDCVSNGVPTPEIRLVKFFKLM